MRAWAHMFQHILKVFCAQRIGNARLVVYVGLDFPESLQLLYMLYAHKLSDRTILARKRRKRSKLNILCDFGSVLCATARGVLLKVYLCNALLKLLCL